MLHNWGWRIRQVWQRVRLAALLLAVVEPLCFGVGEALLGTGAVYFLGQAALLLLGAWLGFREKSDIGRTVCQLYLIDIGLQVAGFFYYCAAYYWVAGFPAWAVAGGQFGYESLNIALSLAKMLAITAAVAVPGQPGWPNLIPGMRQLRDIPGTQASDRLVYIALIGCVGYGFWLRAQHVDLTVVVWLAPVLLGMLADIGRAVGIAPVGGLSGRTRTFAARYEAMSDEEKNLADAMIEAVHDSRREVEAKR